MKPIFYIVNMFLLAGLFSCQEAEQMLFNGVARVQMDEDNEQKVDFYYQDNSILRDTVYLTVNTIGDPEDRVRRIALEQITEYDITYQYDNKGNVVDSTVTEKPNKAVPGVHYVPMDAPEMESLLVIQPNAVTAEIPVIILRDASLKEEEYRLCLQLKSTDDFLLGERDHLSGAIVMADKLSKPNFWTSTVESYYFGTYSTRKYEFMYEVAGEKIDDEWYDRLLEDRAELYFFCDKFKSALEEYNNDPENIAQGLAPMREDQSDPNSPRIVFP